MFTKLVKISFQMQDILCRYLKHKITLVLVLMHLESSGILFFDIQNYPVFLHNSYWDTMRAEVVSEFQSFVKFNLCQCHTSTQLPRKFKIKHPHNPYSNRKLNTLKLLKYLNKEEHIHRSEFLKVCCILCKEFYLHHMYVKKLQKIDFYLLFGNLSNNLVDQLVQLRRGKFADSVTWKCCVV